MQQYIFHISLIDAALFGTVFITLTFSFLLWLSKRTNQPANRFLAIALLVVVLEMSHLLAFDIRLAACFPHWSRFPLQFALAFGPLLFFYVKKITLPGYKFGWLDLLHFSPLVLEQGVFALETRESIKTGMETYHTHVFQQLNPVLRLLTFVSVVYYLYRCRRLIENFYQQLQFSSADRYRRQWHWLNNLLTGGGLVWLLWIPVIVTGYFYPEPRLDYMLYLLLAATIILLGAKAFSWPEMSITPTPGFLKPSIPAQLKQKGIWLKNAVKEKRYYEDPELSLSSLAEKLGIHTHELSKIINTALKKSFNDFINEYRVQAATGKMMDPAFDHITLLGIAYDSGFNSKSTFNLIFKKITGKTPVEYKTGLKKEFLSYNLGRHPRSAKVISNRETTLKWSRENLNRNFMFKSYFKSTWRNLVRHKSYTVINVTGLAIGLASSILILLWVQNEQSYDNFQKNAGQIYRIAGDWGDYKATVNAEAMPAGLKAEIPVVKNMVRLSLASTILFEAGDRKFEEKRVFYADPSFMDVFSFLLVQGDRATALSRVDGVLITQEMATKYFGNENPIGKVLRKDNKENVVVTGVLANIPANSDLQFDFIMPMALFEKAEDPTRNRWENFNFYSYIQLDKSFVPSGDNLSKLEKQMAQLFHRHSPMPVVFHLQPLTQIHLAPARLGDMPGHGNAQYVQIFFITAILILVVACINFMNLATARSARRAKEIGLRKVAGAVRGQLILQFLSEAVFISLLALLLALAVVWLFLPAFNELAARKLALPVSDVRFWLSLLGIALLAGLISGSYPALYLSGFQPVKVLKGNLKSLGGNLRFRNALVIIQFTTSIILLVGTVVIYKQLKFIKDRNPGFEKANLLYMPIKGDLWNRQFTLKNELKQNPLTSDFAITSDLPTDLRSGNGSADWEGKDPNLHIVYQLMDVSEDFIDVFKLKLAGGRSFSRSFPADSNNFMVNEKMLGVMGLKATTAVGKAFSFTGRKGTIVGVLKDFNFKPVQQAIEPLILRYNKDGGFVVVRTLPGKTSATIKALSKISQQVNPAYPFKFDFLDQDMANLYKGEQQMGNIFNLFAALGIFISCLGLYGLSAFMAEQRTKEIGVRKVLGASVLNLVYLLSSGITRLILVAIVIAVPISWYAVNSWLAGFAYHISVSWLVFFTASLAALGIAWVTVSYESIKGALANPVKSLRSE